MPSGPAKLPRVLAVDELERLLEPTRRPTGDPTARRAMLRDDALLELLYGSGLRVSECCGLDLADVELERAMVTVWGKGNKQRRVPMSVASVEAVGRYLDERARRLLVEPDRRPGALFLNQRGLASVRATSGG